MARPRASVAARARAAKFNSLAPYKSQLERRQNVFTTLHSRPNHRSLRHVNRSALLHIVERLEGLLGKLPAAIQKPVLHELTPLKELFLQQRSPRLLLAGAGRWPMPQVVNLLFNGVAVEDSSQVVFEIFRWQDIEIKGRGTISVLDARAADDEAEKTIRRELERESADAIIILSDASEGRSKVKRSAENGLACVHWNDAVHKEAGIMAIHLEPTPTARHNGEPTRMDRSEKLQPHLHRRVWGGSEVC